MSMKSQCKLAGCLLLLMQLPAWGQNVALTGVMGQRALLVINGGTPAVVAPGETREGVRLISVSGDVAVVESDGRLQNLRVGDVPVNLTAGPGSGNGTHVVLPAGPGGHFISSGRINGTSVRFLVDTGATVVSMSAQEADRIGLQYRTGTPLQLNTANGAVQGFQISLTSVGLGGVEVYNVPAIVTANPMPFVLLGNSFLTHFQLKRENDSLTLDKRF
jgi:aspartyl protease family protein